MANNRQSKDERSRNIKLIAGALILSLGASLIWMYFSGAFDILLASMIPLPVQHLWYLQG